MSFVFFRGVVFFKERGGYVLREQGYVLREQGFCIKQERLCVKQH
jgi:hypothetical protein